MGTISFSFQVEIFLSVSIFNQKINKFITLKIERKCHSMIYIPLNYVFIIGGEGTTDVAYYDIQQGQIYAHSDLKHQRAEASLCFIDNSFIYAFSGYSDKRMPLNTFERINLRSNNKIWEEITPIVKEGVNFTQIYYGVCFLNQNQILFIGGHDSSTLSWAKKCHVYNTQENTITSYESEIDIEEDFTEKFFHPVKNFTSINYPKEIYHSEIKLLVFHQNKITQIKFNEEER